MPYPELPEDLAESLAVQFLPYNTPSCSEPRPNCLCQTCFVKSLTRRIRESVAWEAKLARDTLVTGNEILPRHP